MPDGAVSPLISVILPVRNGVPWLDVQMRALADQECEEPWEVVVVDERIHGRQQGARSDMG